MLIEIGLGLYILLIQQIQANDICYYRNQSALVSINCNGVCCPGTATSPHMACCTSILSWRLAIPVVVIVSLCLIAICLVCLRPFLKLCGAGCKCPFRRQSRVISSSPISINNNNPVFEMNNADLPDYETISKDSLGKHTIPPPYNFVAAHPNDFGIETSFIPSAPPEYDPRSNTIEPNAPV
ncbi:unnamed protein product [Rotaria sordida]|uniref:Uncharacterized protein n=1 Tax=Rotaria sordida TaxID=392033 RepID=A0A813ZX23_9BILA|nr:unnamed protein product [Rotaria sordida]